jgi:hypothetical protein
LRIFRIFSENSKTLHTLCLFLDEEGKKVLQGVGPAAGRPFLVPCSGSGLDCYAGSGPEPKPALGVPECHAAGAKDYRLLFAL